jgi:hypothetical protein
MRQREPLDLKDRLMLTPPELVRLYPFSLKSWHRWLAAGEVKGATKVHSRWLVPPESAEAMMRRVPASELRARHLKRMNARPRPKGKSVGKQLRELQEVANA